jgi:hypothetical protein
MTLGATRLMMDAKLELSFSSRAGAAGLTATGTEGLLSAAGFVGLWAAQTVHQGGADITAIAPSQAKSGIRDL